MFYLERFGASKIIGFVDDLNAETVSGRQDDLAVHTAERSSSFNRLPDLFAVSLDEQVPVPDCVQIIV